jgi:hypothetical protein
MTFKRLKIFKTIQLRKSSYIGITFHIKSVLTINSVNVWVDHKTSNVPFRMYGVYFYWSKSNDITQEIEQIKGP